MILSLQDAQSSVPGMPAGTQPSNQSGAPAGGNGSQLAPDGAGGQTPQGPPPGGLSGPTLFLPLIGIMILMIFLSGSAQRKEKKRKAELLANIKKHDRVQMIGGLIATISEVRDDEVVLIIDDQTKTKARYSKAAVQQVLREAPGSAESASEPAEPSLTTQPVT
ncbi:MAG: preprotein translocase subunit YajC [Planctomycetota bacterium]